MSKKYRRKKRKMKRKYQDKRGMNRHHMLNRCMGGKDDVSNLLRIYIYKHQIWHQLFKNMDLDQAIAFLKRVKRAKANQGGSNANDDGYTYCVS